MRALNGCQERVLLDQTRVLTVHCTQGTVRSTVHILLYIDALVHVTQRSIQLYCSHNTIHVLVQVWMKIQDLAVIRG